MNTTCCPDYTPGMDAVNAPIILQSARSGGRYQYTFKPFAYCPWCGKKRDSNASPTSAAKPITPKEAEEKKISSIPDFVIESVNELLSENLSASGYVTILQKTIVSRIKTKMPKLSGSEIFDNKWLDFEDIYRKAGWKVDYDKPAYNEDYEASFKFEKKKG